MASANMFVTRLIVLGVALCMPSASWALGHNETQCDSNVAGTFSYYKLTISRSKEWCFSNNKMNDKQCAFEYVVHGLWPQCDSGYPSDCAVANSANDAIDTNRILKFMPSTYLIKHEWEKHGRCSGLKRSQYFDTVETLYRNLHIPSLRKGMYTASQLSDVLAKNIPGLRPENIEFACDENSRSAHASRATLDEIRICYDRNGKFTPCLERESSCTKLQKIEVRF